MTTKDFLAEMAIREIWTQCRFAQVSYSNITTKGRANTDIVFSSIHSFLAHCANVSKLLFSKKIASALGKQNPAQILNLQGSLRIKSSSFRNKLEHYDKELVKWIKKKGPRILIYDYNIGPKRAFQLPKNSIRVRHYDPTTDTFTLLDEDLTLNDLYQEVTEIQSKAGAWVDALVQRSK